MSDTVHRIFISALTATVIIVFIILIYNGIPYYNTALEERVYHPDHIALKPSGFIGHGLGIIGAFSMITGMLSYMARKRYRSLSRFGLLKHWLEFHIFLCTIGPLLVLFHTAYKFGGLVAISFWSMVAVFISGIIGRFIYIQIPRSIEGRELSLAEVRQMKSNLDEIIKCNYNLDDESYNIITDSTKKKTELYHKNLFIRFIKRYYAERKTLKSVNSVLRRNNLSENELNKVLAIIKNDIKLSRRIDRLETMQNMFRYWHVAHLPFALIMLIIMIIHIGVTVLFGYRWIF